MYGDDVCCRFGFLEPCLAAGVFNDKLSTIPQIRDHKSIMLLAICSIEKKLRRTRFGCSLLRIADIYADISLIANLCKCPCGAKGRRHCERGLEHAVCGIIN